MARKKREGPSLLGIFKEYFTQHPEWLRKRSNDIVIAQFQTDYPDMEVTPRIKQAMFNAKNYMKRGKKGRRRRRRKVEMVQAAMARPYRKTGALQLLEGQIDDCLAMARQIGRDEIGDAINHLHRARNIIVMRIES